MNCREFEKIVLAIARHQLLEAATREQGLMHTEVCARCASRLAEEQALMVGVRAVIVEIAKEEAPARVEAALLAAFREQAAAAALPILTSMPGRPLPSKAGRSAYWKLGAVAAGILILISMAALFWVQSSSPQRKNTASGMLPTPPIAPESSAPAPKPEAPVIAVGQKAPQRQVPPRQPRTPRQAESVSEVEVVTQFFSLMEGDDLSSLEGNQILRVELTGSALLALGLPVDGEMRSRSVKADVVLRHDGLARAIRFVRSN
jgi:hypothetical protein